MIWKDIESDFLQFLPDLKTGRVEEGESSCQWFFLPEGFKNQGQVLVFGFVDWKNPLDAKKIIDRLNSLGKEFQATKLVGPLNLSTYLNYRVKLDFFEDPPYPGEPVNSPDMPKTLEQNGFEIEKRYLSSEFRVRQLKFLAYFYTYGTLAKRRMLRKGYTMEFLSKENCRQYLKPMHEIIDEIFHRNYMYLNVPHSVFLKYVEENYIDHISSDVTAVVLDPNKKVIGFTLGLFDCHRPDRALFKTIGVKIEHSHKGQMTLWILSEIIKRNIFKYKNCLACLAIENKGIQKLTAQYGHKKMTYGLYSRKVN